jgi:preprotein translocase subunit SecG
MTDFPNLVMSFVFVGFIITCLFYLVITHKEDDDEQQRRSR